MWPRVCILTLLVAAGARAASAQAVTNAGWIVTVRGDTLRGTVRFTPGEAASSSIRMTRADEEDEVVLPSAAVASINLQDGRRYVMIDTEVDGQSMSLLLEVLVDGYAGLLYDANVRLEQIFVITHQSGDAVPVRERYYVGVIAQSFSECESLGKLDQVQIFRRYPFEPNALRRAVIEYNRCVRPQDAVVMHRRQGKGVRFGFLASAGLSDVAFQKSPRNLLTTNFDPGHSFSVGTFAKLGFGRERFGTQPKLMVTRRNATFDDQDCVATCVSKAELSTLIARIDAPAHVYFPVGRSMLSFFAGPTVCVLLARNGELESGSRMDSIDLEDVEAGYTAGIQLGAGERYLVSIQWHNTWTVANNVPYQTRQRIAEVSIGILL